MTARHDALVFIISGLMTAIEQMPACEETKDGMTNKAQQCLVTLGVGVEEMELAILDVDTEDAHG